MFTLPIMFIVPLLRGETMVAARYLVMDMTGGAPVGSLDSHLAFFLLFSISKFNLCEGEFDQHAFP